MCCYPGEVEPEHAALFFPMLKNTHGETEHQRQSGYDKRLRNVPRWRTSACVDRKARPAEATRDGYASINPHALKHSRTPPWLSARSFLELHKICWMELGSGRACTTPSLCADVATRLDLPLLFCSRFVCYVVSISPAQLTRK